MRRNVYLSGIVRVLSELPHLHLNASIDAQFAHCRDRRNWMAAVGVPDSTAREAGRFLALETVCRLHLCTLEGRIAESARFGTPKCSMVDIPSRLIIEGGIVCTPGCALSVGAFGRTRRRRQRCVAHRWQIVMRFLGARPRVFGQQPCNLQSMAQVRFKFGAKTSFEGNVCWKLAHYGIWLSRR